MGQRLRIVGWLRFGTRARLEKGVNGFSGRAAPGYYDEGSWELDDLDARVSVATELPGDFDHVEWPFLSMIREASFGYLDYFEEGNQNWQPGRKPGEVVKRWALAPYNGKQAQLAMSVGTSSLGYPEPDGSDGTTMLVEVDYRFATPKAALAAVGAFRLPILLATGVRELRLGQVLRREDVQVTLKATVVGPWRQLHEPIVEALTALSAKAAAGRGTLRGDQHRYEIAPRGKITHQLAHDHISPWTDAPTLTLVDPSTPEEPAPQPAQSTPVDVARGGKRAVKPEPARAKNLPADGGPVVGASLMPDGRLLTWGGDQVTFWSLPDLEILRTVKLSQEYAWPLEGACELPDGRVVMFHDMDGEMQLVDGRTGEVRSMKGHEHTVKGAVLFGDRLLTWSIDGTVRRWTLTGDSDGVVVPRQEDSIREVVRLADGTALIITDGAALRLRAATGEVVERLDRVTACHALSGGRHLLENYGKFELRGGASPLRFTVDEGNDHRVVEVSPERLVVLAHRQLHEVSLRDGTTREVNTGHTKDVGALTPLGGDLWATHGRSMPGLNERFGFDGRLKVWSSDGWREVAVCDLRSPIAEAIGLRGGRVAVRLEGALSSKEVSIVEGSTGQLRTTLKGAKKAVRGVRELPDGRLLVWSKEGSARVVPPG